MRAMLRELWVKLSSRRDRRTARRRVGDAGERLAIRYLKGVGYRIAAKNVRVHVGHAASGRAVIGEIDVVAYEGDILSFIEVKTRRRVGLFGAERAVDARKRDLLRRAARRYRGLLGIRGAPFRFDVVTVLLPEGEPPIVRLTRDYFASRPWTQDS